MSAPTYEYDFNYWSVARKSHWKYLKELDRELYGTSVDAASCRLKNYQDLAVMHLIKSLLPNGGKILEVGGGVSRILNHYSKSHECWNIDKFEGLGNGPTKLQEFPYKVVRRYMGEFSAEIPSDYFDLIFSISALEHVENPTMYIPICQDIHRALKPGGLSAHFLDIVLRHDGGYWTNGVVYTMNETGEPLNEMVDLSRVSECQDLYTMSKEAYDLYWKEYINKEYDHYGSPSNIAMFWTK